MSIIRLEESNPQYSRTNTKVLTVYSSHLERRQDITIYNANSTAKDLPIVILLHGVYGNNWVWMDLGGVHLVYEKLRQQGLTEFVLVMPSDGGIWEGSAYLPLQDNGDFEQWIVEDVIHAVNTTVDAVSSNSSIYISGLSMGGYGALRLGSKYPDIFNGISAHSSITQLSDMALFTETPLDNYRTENEHEADILYWCKQNRHLLPPFRFDCGSDDELFESNRLFSQALNKTQIEHEFVINEGCHEWSYWHNHVATTFRFFEKIEIGK